MSAAPSTAVYASFAGRDQRFELRIGELRELERITGSGVGAIWRRVATLEFRVDDLRETIRLGLVGGGLGLAEAEAMMRFNVDARPVNDYFALAVDILKAAFEGVAPKKAGGATSAATPMSGAPETSAASTN